MNIWEETHQIFEKNWWGTCANTYWEETKQRVYANRMGLIADMDEGKFPVYDLKGISVLDIGGGPVSLLLKTINRGFCLVVDPCKYPKWVADRYRDSEIEYGQVKGEEINIKKVFDEVWIYNVLQHTEDPELIIKNARKCSKLIRIFEWIDHGTSTGHPINLTEKDLNLWLGGTGKVELLNESGCHGKSYYGIFKGNHYEKV